jgi:hypothetical protein
MIRGLVFSKDRALQLDATLTSFFRHASDAADVEMVVLYRSSSPRHEAQYIQLAGQYGDRVRFVPETAFRRQVLEILKTPIRSARNRKRDPFIPAWRSSDRLRTANTQDHVLFLVDDSIFIRPFGLGAAVQAIDANSDAAGLSLRLGTNTRYCYALDRRQSLPEFKPLVDGTLKFGWVGADGDFAYPLELSSSLYPLGLIVGMIDRLAFSDPNTLESKMAVGARHLARRWPALLCYPVSVAFCTPLNRVQQVYMNRAGDAEKFSKERLADAFEQGRRINIGSLDGFVPSACHQEVELTLD